MIPSVSFRWTELLPVSTRRLRNNKTDRDIAGITNPKCPDAKDAVKSFNFDYSYWSHDVSITSLLVLVKCSGA